MTRDDIILMAKEAGFERTKMHGALERFAHIVAAAEREACAKVAEERLLYKANCTAEEMYELQKKSIAADIRAKGQG